MDILKILKDRFHHSEFRGDQKQIIESVLKGKNVLCLMPTGMGKSLCYQLPTCVQGGLTLVISPLIALMQDQVYKLEELKIKATCLHSLLSKEERKKRYIKIQKKQFDVVLVTPERFRKSEFLDVIKENVVKLLVVDEAHCISEWGHDFRPDYSRIKEFRSLVNNPPTLMMTATATPQVQRDIIKNTLNEDETHEFFFSGIKRDNLSIEVHECYGIEGKIKKYLELNCSSPSILYFTLISTLEKVSVVLESQKISHLKYHGSLPRNIRQKNQKKFLESKEIILATPAFGLGIDKKDIRSIVHFELPSSIEAYYQEVGRAGRDGKPSQCHLLYDEDDITTQMEFIKWAHPERDFIIKVFDLIKKNPQAINQQGEEFLKEQLHFKSSHDFRLETVLNLFDRWGVTEGDLFSKNLNLISEIPEHLLDQKKITDHIKNDQVKLLKLVQAIKAEDIKASIYEYFTMDQ